MVEERLLERGVVVSYETIRRCGLKIGADYARGSEESGQTAL
jgi:putative transposase